MTQPIPASVRELVALWPSYFDMAADLRPLVRSVREHQPRDWARRGRIPSEYIDAIVRAAQQRGFREVTHKLVAELAAKHDDDDKVPHAEGCAA